MELSYRSAKLFSAMFSVSGGVCPEPLPAQEMPIYRNGGNGKEKQAYQLAKGDER